MIENIDVNQEEETSTSALGLSDEDFANLPEPPVYEVDDDETATDTRTDDSANTDSGSSDTAEVQENSEDSGEDSEEEGEDSGEETSTESAQQDTDSKSIENIDYKSEYGRLTAPFRANGTEIKVNSTDEIIALMQMGANYHKKMASLKPAMKVMKLLERHELMDESKLSYLIDLNKKNPAAIGKLVKDSGIDPMDIDVDAATNYTPQTTGISDTEMELESVLEAIQETPTYPKTLKVVSEIWDDASRNAIAAAPHIISIINEHVSSGVFDKVYGEVERARRFGKLTGVSDFEAYKTMGDYMHAQGLLAPGDTPSTATDSIKEQQEAKRKAAKKAATITTGKVTASAKPPTNVLAMSDEEFEKLPATAYTKV